MKGERPLSQFMHYAEGEAPGDRGVVCGSSIYKCFETGRFMPGSPRGTLQIPGRLLPTQPCRSRRERPWPAGEGDRDVARIVRLLEVCMHRIISRKWIDKQTTYTTTNPHPEHLWSVLENGILQQPGTGQEASGLSYSRGDRKHRASLCLFFSSRDVLKQTECSSSILPFSQLLWSFLVSSSVSRSINHSTYRLSGVGCCSRWVDRSQAQAA